MNKCEWLTAKWSTVSCICSKDDKTCCNIGMDITVDSFSVKCNIKTKLYHFLSDITQSTLCEPRGCLLPVCKTWGNQWSRSFPTDNRSHTYSSTYGEWVGKVSGLFYIKLLKQLFIPEKKNRMIWTYSIGFPLISAMIALSPPRYS